MAKMKVAACRRCRQAAARRRRGTRFLAHAVRTLGLNKQGVKGAGHVGASAIDAVVGLWADSLLSECRIQRPAWQKRLCSCAPIAM